MAGTLPVRRTLHGTGMSRSGKSTATPELAKNLKNVRLQPFGFRRSDVFIGEIEEVKIRTGEPILNSAAPAHQDENGARTTQVLAGLALTSIVSPGRNGFGT